MNEEFINGVAEDSHHEQRQAVYEDTASADLFAVNIKIEVETTVQVNLTRLLPVIYDDVIKIEASRRMVTVQLFLEPVNAMAVGVPYLVVLVKADGYRRKAELLAMEHADSADF